jgi:hypothetical protein
MKLLEEAGIYVFTSVSTIFSSINRAEPYKSYHRPALGEYFQTVNAMAQYPNTLGLLAGNGIINGPRNQRCAPVIKAVVRDLKRYMKVHHEATGQRIIPIGYTAAPVDLLDTTVLGFLSQGDPASSIDFWTVSHTPSPQKPLLKPSSATVTCGQGHRTTRSPATTG